MKALTFRKGVHPNDQKALTADQVIEVVLPKGELVFPLSQHIGAPCVPLVKKGDLVQRGQKIAEAKGPISSPIHSSVTGKVVAIEPRMTLRGTKEESIVIALDLQEEKQLDITGQMMKPLEDLSKESVVQRVKEAGIVGMGGATFPTHVKLNTPPDKVVDYLIVNAAECEPYLTSDYRVMLEEGQWLVAGLEILLQIFPKAQAIIGIEENKQVAAEHLIQLVQGKARMAVQCLRTKYPQGSEKHLIWALTHREVPSGKLPIEVGCIVQNVDTIVAIAKAVRQGEPLMRRIVTVSGKGVAKPCNLSVRIGTSIEELLAYAKYDAAQTVKIICGGPMMGVAVADPKVPVMKGTSAILCLTKEELEQMPQTACIRCGKCVAVCPMDLAPYALHHSALHNHFEQFEKAHGMDCIECGCCAYTCPAKRDLVQSIRTAKASIRRKK